MNENIELHNKFTFASYDLASRVRSNMFSALLPYDKNFNGCLQQPQIVEALINILNEDEEQIQYALSIIFGQNKEGDKIVTSQEFVNFAVQQHFGVITFQKIYNSGFYSRRDQKLLNLDEFQTTLNYNLRYIAAEGSRDQYERLFSQIDLDHDGWINFEEFFDFLKEYFGSLSYAAIHVQRKEPSRKINQLTVRIAEERFARLIYTQFKISIMEYDLSKSLSLKRQQVGGILRNIFKIETEQISQLIKHIFNDKQAIDYESFMKKIVPFNFCEYCIQKHNINQVSKDSFVKQVKNASFFVPIKPSQAVLQEIFTKADTQNKGYLQKQQYINTLGKILQSYKFDMRGTGTAK